jgi:HlyD family secretion protein
MKQIVHLWCIAAIALCCISCEKENGIPGGSGLIEATKVIISAEIPGRVEQVYFDEGEAVSSGDTIALIDTTTISLRLQQTDALMLTAQAGRQRALINIEKADQNFALAKTEYDRISRLLKAGSTNQQQFDKTENTYKQAELSNKSAEVALHASDAELARIEADMALLRKQLSDCRPLAGVRGTVITTFVEAGELIGIGKPIIKIARLDTVWVKVYLPPGDLTGIKLGNRAEVDPEDGREEPLVGTVSWIAAEAEFTPKNVQTKQARADLVYAVKITIPNPERQLKIGMPVSVRIP